MSLKYFVLILSAFCLAIACNDSDSRPPNYQTINSIAEKSSSGGAEQVLNSTGGTTADLNVANGFAGVTNDASINVQLSFGYDTPASQYVQESDVPFGAIHFALENKSICTPVRIVEAEICQTDPLGETSDISRISIALNDAEILFAKTAESGCWILKPVGDGFVSLALGVDAFWVNVEFVRTTETAGHAIILKLRHMTFNSTVTPESLTISLTLEHSSSNRLLL